MANGAIAAALRGFAANAEKRDATCRLSLKARERSQVRYLRTSDALQLQRVKFEEKLEKTMRRAAFVFCRFAFLAIIVGSTGRDAELLRIARRQRGGVNAFAGCLEPKRTLQPMTGLDAANRKSICPWSRRRRSVRNRLWASRAPTSGRRDGPLWAAAGAAAAFKPFRVARSWQRFSRVFF